jgi:hypothetical protein
VRKSILSCALVATIGASFGLQLAAFAAAPLSVRIDPSSGLCYWHCAEQILRTRGSNVRLVDAVISSGNTEASLDSVGRFLTVTPIPTCQEAIPLTHRGTHVIATLRFDAGLHAVVMVDVKGDKVVFWNPNEPNAYGSMSMGEFRRRWVIGTVVN